MMNRIRAPFVIALLLIALPAFGETIHLKSGESIKGKIIGMDDQNVSIESEKGYGVLQVPRSDILVIEYPEEGRDPSRTIGFGYLHHSTPASGTGAATPYAVDSLSIKYWLDREVSLDVLFGFFNSSTKGSADLEIFSLDLRLAKVFKRQAELDLYYGGSIGYLSVKDKAAGVDDTGSNLGAFLGAEVFFVTLPNLGISAEIGIGVQKVGDRSTTSVTTTTFPTLSMRYYF